MNTQQIRDRLSKLEALDEITRAPMASYITDVRILIDRIDDLERGEREYQSMLKAAIELGCDPNEVILRKHEIEAPEATS